MFASRTIRRRHVAAAAAAAAAVPAVESLEARQHFDGSFLSQFLQTDPYTGQQTLFGYPTGGGAISGILGADYNAYMNNPTPDNVANFVYGVTSGFSPYNLSDPYSDFYYQYAAPNTGNPYPNYDLWLLMNGYAPQNDPNLAGYVGNGSVQQGVNDSAWTAWSDVLWSLLEDSDASDANAADAGGTFNDGAPVTDSGSNWADSGSNWTDSGWTGWDAGSAGNAGSALSAGNAGSALSAGNAGSAMSSTGAAAPVPQEATRVPPARTKADLKLIAKIQKTAAKVGRDAGDLTFATTAELRSLAQDLKQLPKKRSLLKKVEAVAARTGAQVAAGARDLSMSLAELKSYLKQLKAGA